jgi:hypothetical protein
MDINDIKIIKHNSDYRVADIITKCGERWEHSGNMVINHDKYKQTILQSYLKQNGLYESQNFNLLLSIIKKFNTENRLPLPEDNELVIHLRLGDVVVHNWFLKKDYIALINEQLRKNKNIDKITFVTCFAYQEWSAESLHLRKNAPLWDYTEEKQNKNVEKVTILFDSVMKTFPGIKMKIYSNTEIDKDLCYCVLSKHYIHDDGGFTNLCLKLNQLNNH